MIRKLLIGILVLVNGILLYSVIFSDRGVLSLRRMQAEREDLAARVGELKGRSQKLSQEILWLEKGGAYTERIIRDKTNFLKDDEIVYIIEADGPSTPARGGQGRGVADQ